MSLTIAAAAGAPGLARADYGTLPLAQPDTKGTIGLVCIDNFGNGFTWYQNRVPANPFEVLQRNAFDDCVNTVVANWATASVSSSNTGREANVDVDFNEMLGGYSSYRNALNRNFRSGNVRR